MSTFGLSLVGAYTLHRFYKEVVNKIIFPFAIQSQSQRLPRSSLPAADLTAGMEIMAQRRGSMDDSFHLPDFPWHGMGLSNILPYPYPNFAIKSTSFV